MPEEFKFIPSWYPHRPKDGTECQCGKQLIMCEIIYEDTGGFCCPYCEHVGNVE